MGKTTLQKKIVVIGGGTGSFTLLSSLKYHFSDITALVNMVDDGGSSGVLRDELGVLPPGDVRQCLIALSDAPDKLRRLFNFRFAQGTFAGHSFGNLFLSAVERMTDDFDEAVSMASEVLQISGRVIPMTTDNCKLHMRIGKEHIVGEYAISGAEIDSSTKPTLWLTPPARITPSAQDAIEHADIVVIAPGSLYGSLIPALLVEGVSDALSRTKAPLVYVANLVNKPHQTKGFFVQDYVAELERFLTDSYIDTVLYNTDKPQPGLLKRYALEGEFPVGVNQKSLKQAHFQAIGGHFLNKDHLVRDKNDTRITRSLIRHDAEAIAGRLVSLFGS
ncbi:hypothetical protein BH23PAT2_BH23PAT2_06540 [soil metagenome]